MPGVVPLEDAQNYYVDRLKQHAQDGWQALTSTAAQAPQQLAAAAPAAPQIDPNEIIQRLQQHAQQAWQDAQDQAQQAVQGAQQTVQQAQPTQQPLPTVDASDVTNRLQQHAQDTWKSLDAGVQQIGQGAQSFNQPPPQAPTPATQDASANAQATSAVIQPNQTSQPQPTQPQADQTAAPDRSMSFQDYARAAAQKAGIDPNVFMAQIQQESGFNPSARSPAGAIGIAQFMPATAAGVDLDPTDPYASLDAAAAEDAKRLQQYEGDWGKTLASYNAGAGAVAQYGGIPPYKETQTYVSTIMGNAQKAADAAGTAISGAVQAGKQAVGDAASAVGTGAQNAVQGAQQAISNKLPDVSQFGDKQLTAAEAYAACGPAAAVRFAQMFGRNPSLREATDLASKVGWTSGSGMAGLQSESKLFDEMGIPHRTVGADWTALAKEASSGNPVTISTPGHYFTADSYDASTGAFHVGRSGLDLRVGKEWMTPAEMEAAMGKLQGGLAADNPQTPAPSPLAQPATTSRQSYTTPRTVMGGLQDAAGTLASDASHAIGQGMQGVGQAIGGTLQTVDDAVQSAASQATAQVTLKPGEEPATTTLSAAATNAAPAVQAGTQAAQDTLRKVPGPFGVSTVGDIADTAGNIASKVQTPDENAPGGVVGRAVGTGLSALGSAAQEANAALDKINIASNLARDATGSDQYNNLYAQAGGPALEDEYRTLLQRRMNGDDSVSPRMTAIVNQLQSINDGIRGGTSRQDQGELNQRLSEQNPLTGSAVGLANVGAAGLATVLAAGDAPLALRAVAEMLQPGTNPLEIARALTAVNDAKGVAPEVANAVDNAWQQFGGRLTDTAAERAQQIAKMDDTGRNHLVQAITNAVPSRRMYHGTSSEFASVDPSQIAGENNLYGPGYYLTSDPQVAGGVVARGDEQVGPSWLKSGVTRGEGDVINAGYAQSGGGANAPGDVAALAGPNVRSVDVPHNLNLLNIDRYVQPSDLDAIRAQLPPNRVGVFDSQIGRAFEGRPTGQQVWDALNKAHGNTLAARAETNRVLAAAGFDGIEHAGGQRIPMQDAAGRAIQHDVNVIFPESLDKIRNAVSGTQGGQVAAPFAARLGGAAAGGAVGYQTTPEDASPQERALRTGAGAVAGYAGVAAASKVVSALSDLMKPGLAAPQLEQAIKTVNETTASVPDIIDQVRKMPGTAELAPVRQQVPQSSTDLLQAMLDAARAKGVDPDKLASLEKQITDMDPTAATRRALTPPPAAGTPGAAEVPGVGGAVGDFLRGEAGAVPITRATLRGGTTLGGAVAGGVAGNASTPDDAMTVPTPLGDLPIERGARILAGAGIGAGLGSLTGYRGTVDQRVLESLRNSGITTAAPTPAPPVGGLLREGVEQTKQLLLTGPHTHIANVIGNTIELGRQPIALAMGGRGDDALSAITSVVKALPQAAGNALQLTRGLEPANLSQGAALVPRRYPIYRMLSAADAFTRTLGEYQGMSAKANQLLRDAGIAPSDPTAAAFLSSHSSDLFQAGKERGAQSVFGQAGTAATARTGLEGVFRALGTYKEGLLASPNPLAKAAGAMLDFELPFSGVPVRMLSLVASRAPVGAQVRGMTNIAKALGKGDTAGAQHALGEMAMESTIQFLIAQNVANGNIRGPNDVEHPNGIHMPGIGWVDTSEWGGYALPMQTMAAFAEGYQKGGTNMPEGTNGNDYLNYYGPRYTAAFDASMKPFLQAVPGMNMIRLLSTALHGNATDVGTKLSQDVVSRMAVPGMARFIENATDPSARDLAKKGPQAPWDTFLAGWPGLAQNLPVKIDPTTGEPMDKKKSGLGTLIGAQQDFASPLSIEADRLNKAGFKDVSAPTAYPDGVTIGGSKVNLSPDEQREVTQITGSRLDQLAERMNSGEYQNAPDVRKAQMLKAIIADADKTRESAVTRVLGGAELRSRVLAGRQTAGQLRNQAEPPSPFNPLGFLSPQQEPVAAGAR